MAYENILVEHDPAISTITVNRPKALNALNSHTLRELTLAVRECADSRVIILTGAGDRAFVAGADIAEMGARGCWGTADRSARRSPWRDRSPSPAPSASWNAATT